jgi:malate/lactate dehydrogenase
VTIVILGAGDLGAALARQVAAADTLSRVVLVDESGTVAAGKALDIAQSGPVDRFSTALAGTDDESAVVGAGIIAIADRASGSAEWEGEAGLALLRRVSGFNPSAPILCAGTSSSALVERGVSELGLSPARIFGTAPSALQAAVVALTALEADQSPVEISLSVVGRAPNEIIVSWEAASIGGRRATDVLTPPALRRLEDRLPRLWPPGPTTLGCAAAEVVRSMLTRSPRTHALLVAGASVEATLQGRLNGRGRPAMLPARVHRGGILRLETPSLSSRDRTRLETALAH